MPPLCGRKVKRSEAELRDINDLLLRIGSVFPADSPLVVLSGPDGSMHVVHPDDDSTVPVNSEHAKDMCATFKLLRKSAQAAHEHKGEMPPVFISTETVLTSCHFLGKHTLGVQTRLEPYTMQLIDTASIATTLAPLIRDLGTLL